MVTESFLGELEAAAQRYDERAERRRNTLALLEQEGILHADAPERVDKRLRRLNSSWSLARAIERTPAIGSSGRSLADALAPEMFGADVLGLERLLGRSELIDVGFLERGARAARSIGRIAVGAASGSPMGFGTGFLISPRLLLTNNHVLDDAAVAAESHVEFDFQAGIDGMQLAPVGFRLVPDDFFVTNRKLDFSAVAVSPKSANGRVLADFGSLRLIEAEGKVILGELLNIIQHPGGEPKQLALRDNKLVDLLEHFLHYETDTQPGSSGSPVFNDQWEVVALHHSGVPKRDESGQLLAIDGSPWAPAMGESQLAWIANEGVRISRVLRALRDEPLTGTAATLRAEIFAAATPATITASGSAVAAPADLGTDVPAGSVAQIGGQQAVFTLPLRISVALDPGAAAVPLAADEAPDTRTGRAARASAGPLDQALLRSGLASLEANRNRPYYEERNDAEARDRYYAGVDEEAEPDSLLRALAELLDQTHSPKLRYRPADLVYPWVDLHPDRLLRSIYSGKEFPPERLIEEDARVEALRTARLQQLAAREAALGPGELAAELNALESELPFNCEHVVPQSSFAKREPMRGDLHHLFACESGCNSFRGNTPYFEFEDAEEVVRTDCGRREQDRFEPAAGKGAVARATLYFLLRYPGVLGDEQRELQAERLPVLFAWHEADAVGKWERHRNAAIAELQGNRNPLIDHPEWAERIAFETAFG